MAADTIGNISTDQTQLDLVSFKFVLSEGYTPETCPSMLAAYQQCEDESLSAQWMTEEEFLRVNNASKKDFFILEPFEGVAFQHGLKLLKFKCVIIGPRCLTFCLLHKQAIPPYLYPMHNMAMHNMVITCTEIEPVVRSKIKTLVEYMAGIYSPCFSENVSHLIAGSTLTDKYKVAVEKEVPVMLSSWVFAVWEAMGGTSSAAGVSGKSGASEIVATDHRFLSHVCPVFMKQIVCVSQLPRSSKHVIEKMVLENGGEYSPSLDMNRSTLLVLLYPEGEKFTYAKAWKIPCVTPEYIQDSVQAGYALDVNKYAPRARANSTPTKPSAKLLPPDVSMVSAINVSLRAGQHSGSASHIDETASSEPSFMCAPHTRNSRASEEIDEAITALDSLSLADVEQSGMFLDGCKVYLSGWASPGSAAHVEKLRKILNLGSATRFNQLTEAVTHVVLGSVNSDVLSRVKDWTEKPFIVSANWLIESLKLRRPANEADFICVHYDEANEIDPIEKKQRNNKNLHKELGANDTTLNLLSNNAGHEAADEQHDEDDVLRHYRELSNTGQPEANQTSVTSTQASTQFLPIFEGLSFVVSGYDTEMLQSIESCVAQYGGEVLPLSKCRAGVDYCVVNEDGRGTLVSRARNYVTHRFIEECNDLEKLVAVDFYHLPLMPRLESFSAPLENVVITTSSYSGAVREFIVRLATILGARYQEVFARKNNSNKNVLACSHLVCAAPDGDKFRASVKWRMPAVTMDWLLSCAQSWSRASETPFTVTADRKPQALPALHIVRELLAEHIPSEEAPDDSLNDSTLIAPTPVFCKRVQSVLELASVASGASPITRGGPINTPGKPTTPSAIVTPDLETLRRMYPTPGRKVTSDVNDSLDQMPTPDTPYGCAWNPNPSPRTRKRYKRMLESLPENDYERLSKVRKAECEYVTGLCKNMFDRVRQTLGYEDSPELPTFERKPLADCVICVSKKLDSQYNEIDSMATRLGAGCKTMYDTSVTHYLYRGKTLDKEARVAKEAGKFIVSPEWLKACLDGCKKVEEMLFHPSHKPNMSLTVVSEKLSPTKTVKDLERLKNSVATKHFSDLGTFQNASDLPEFDSDITKLAVQETVEHTEVALDLEELEQLAADTDTQHSSVEDSKQSANALPGLVLSMDRRSLSKRRSQIKGLRSEPHASVSGQSNLAVGTMDLAAGSQGTNIAWADPTDTVARARLVAPHGVTGDDSTLINAELEEQNEELNEEGKEQEIQNDESEERPRYYFAISNNDFCKELLQTIEALGAVYEEDVTERTTHLITSRPSRSEKQLKAIAMGKWVVSLSFVSDSFQAGNFLDEAPYEWGSSSNDLVMGLRTIERKVAEAGHRWRLKLSKRPAQERGSFVGWHVVLASSPERCQQFVRLLSAGCAKVYSEKDLVESSLLAAGYSKPKLRDSCVFEGSLMRRWSSSNLPENITHCFIDSKRRANFDFALFAHHGIPCLDTMFINNYLLEDEPIDPFDCCLNEYQEIVTNMSELPTMNRK